jgi:hypothetical protein
LTREVWLNATDATRVRIVRFINTQMGAHRGGIKAQALDNLIRDYAAWIMEIVCDVFAARLLGPSYLFSIIEFIRFRHDLMNGSESHPPSATRLWITLQELRSLGWQPDLDDDDLGIREPPRWTVAEIRAAPSAERPYRILERCMLELMPAVKRVVRDKVGAHAYKRAEYLDWADTATELLAHRIPPGERQVSGQRPAGIPPRAILNAGWHFHRNGYPGWPEIRGEPLRSAFEKRQLLNRLILKALDTSYIVRNWWRDRRGGKR